MTEEEQIEFLRKNGVQNPEELVAHAKAMQNVDMKAYLQAKFEEIVEAAQAWEDEKELYAFLRTNQPEPWLGHRTKFQKLMWIQHQTYEKFSLFDVEQLSAPESMQVDDIDRCLVHCPGTSFFYCERILHPSRAIEVVMSRATRGLLFFDGPVRIPILFEQMGEADGFTQRVWMSVTPMEMLTQKAGITMASGRVVVGGLGLGWFLKEIADKKDVREIVVVEKNRQLLEWISPRLCEKYPQVAAKVKEWVPADIYDFMKFDLQHRNAGSPSWHQHDDTKYLLDIWPKFGDADHDPAFAAFYKGLGKKRLWGWGYGSDDTPKPTRIDAIVDAPDERVYGCKKPCAECPFTPKGVAVSRSQVDPIRIIAQAHANFVLPCHCDENYDKERHGKVTTLLQCAGAATFRSNIGVADKLPPVLHVLPADTETVFPTAAHLLAAFRRIPLGLAKAQLSMLSMEELIAREREGVNAKNIAVRKEE